MGNQIQEKEASDSSKQDRPLNQETIDEIKKIRERVGIKLFGDQERGKEFENQLQKIHKNRFGNVHFTSSIRAKTIKTSNNLN